MRENTLHWSGLWERLWCVEGGREGEERRMGECGGGRKERGVGECVWGGGGGGNTDWIDNLSRQQAIYSNH